MAANESWIVSQAPCRKSGQNAATLLGRGADRAGKPQGRRRQQKAVAPARAQPFGQRREVPQLAQVHAQLEQAMLVQRQCRAASVEGARGLGFDRVVVRDQGGQARVRDPLQQALVAPIQH
ncbi:hypothetical protein, partial [Pseudomonas aeruginosa]|uniref:hypothetical protein n=1 Tax=Pseudomonas aeruginosa TaxID=287 RepID=UPI0015B9927D